MAEKKYIDGAALLTLIPHIDGETSMQCVERAVEQCVPADVVEVLRCKDCKHYGTGSCAMDTYAFDVVEEGFCSYGERKETEP